VLAGAGHRADALPPAVGQDEHVTAHATRADAAAIDDPFAVPGRGAGGARLGQGRPLLPGIFTVGERQHHLGRIAEAGAEVPTDEQQPLSVRGEGGVMDTGRHRRTG
jgi:hypothetical protein